MRTHVDLFSGIGGFSLACEWAGVETIAFAEIDPYASRVLERHFPGVRNYGDVRGFPRHSAWLLTAGVPCQPASVAGKRKGADDDRWLWPETLAIVENGSYEWLLFENPTGILSLNDGLEFERICAALESKGYEVQPLVIPACATGALHRRDRVWIMGHAKRSEWWAGTEEGRHGANRNDTGREEAASGSAIPSANGERGHMADTASTRSYAAPLTRLHSREESGRARNAEPERRGSDVADANDAGSQRRIGSELCECASQQPVGASDSSMADAACERINGNGHTGQRWRPELTNGSWWSTEPNVGGALDGFSRWLDGYGGLDGAPKMDLQPEAVCSLWDAVLSQGVGIRANISPEAVLLVVVCKLKGRAFNEAWIQSSSAEALEAKLRGVQFDGSKNCPPCRSGQVQQHAREHPNALQDVSRLLARHGEKAWAAYRRSDASPVLGWEDGFARVTSGVTARVDRLRGLGNAIVPQVAYQIIKRMIESEARCTQEDRGE